METTVSTYEQQAIDFLNATGSTIECVFLKNDFHFPDDDSTRDIYTVTIKRGARSYSFSFGQSIMDSQYYKDTIPGRTYTLNGKRRTGNYSINDIKKYQATVQQLQLIKGVIPSNYSILCCLTKYDPGTFENFCADFGYDTDSRRAEKTYSAVKEEYKSLCALFNDNEMEMMQKIQ